MTAGSGTFVGGFEDAWWTWKLWDRPELGCGMKQGQSCSADRDGQGVEDIDWMGRMRSTRFRAGRGSKWGKQPRTWTCMVGDADPDPHGYGHQMRAGATPAVLNKRESREKPEDEAYNVYQNIDLTNTHRAIHVADLRHPPHDAKRLPHVQ